MIHVGLIEVVFVGAFLMAVAVVDAPVLLALSAGYERLGWGPRGLALGGGAAVLIGQAVLIVLATRAWSMLFIAGPDSPVRGPGWAQSELGPSAVVQSTPPYLLGVTCASAVMLIGASVIALAVWKSSRRRGTAAPAGAQTVVAES